MTKEKMIEALNEVKYQGKQVSAKLWERENKCRIYVDHFQGNASFFIEINRVTKKAWSGVQQGLCHSQMGKILKLANITL